MLPLPTQIMGYSPGANRKLPFTLEMVFGPTTRCLIGESWRMARSSGPLTAVWLWMMPPNHAVPAVSEVVEVRYLYAFFESGSIYQPVYLGKRCDIPASECTTDQLKYKTIAEAA